MNTDIRGERHMATFNIGAILFEIRITPNIIKIYNIEHYF